MRVFLYILSGMHLFMHVLFYGKRRTLKKLISNLYLLSKLLKYINQLILLQYLDNVIIPYI
jgi:hypothetical protein